MDNKERIIELQKQIDRLPAGTVTFKKIRGKSQPYLQWSENGKTRSKYIKEADREAVYAAVEERRRLQAELKRVKAESDPLADYVYTAYAPQYVAEEQAEYDAYSSAARFRTKVVMGNALSELARGTEGWERRDCFSRLMDYINGGPGDMVAVIYGLRRTGKTTLIKQAINELLPAHGKRIVYIKLRRSDKLADLNLDLDRLATMGIKYVFLDEVTLLPDFIDGAGVLSDVYSARGIKIVMSGTDSLGFWLSRHDELYDRAIMLHTTWISFKEHSRLLGIHDIDEYIRYGGTLRAADIDFEMTGAQAETASFRDEESTREYIDTAICRNIQHSLAYNEDGRHFLHLQQLYDSCELTGAINRIIEDTNHRFLLSVLTRSFRSHDYGSAADVLRKRKDPAKRSYLLDEADREEITRVLASILEIRNREDQASGITSSHVAQIRQYLEALDLIAYCPEESLIAGVEPVRRTLITQPGMRYVQAQALAFAVMRDPAFRQRPNHEKNNIISTILEEVRGRMLEEIVLLETTRTIGPGIEVSHIDTGDGGDIDMLIYDSEHDTCSIYEIKHSSEAVPFQYHMLTDEKYCREIERRFGDIKERIVLYKGPDLPVNADGITYINVEEYLQHPARRATC